MTSVRVLAQPIRAGRRGIDDDGRIVEALRCGDETAFAVIVDAWGASMIRASLAWVSSRAVAEEVVQETWLRMLRGLPRFEGRSSLRTWVFVILGNCARKRAAQERRSVPFASLAAGEARGGSAVDPDEFFPDDHPRWAGAWSTVVTGVSAIPEDRLLSGETRELVRAAIERLPVAQRTVMTLRDVEGWSAEETSTFLGISEGNQRVLLHRARAKVREAMRGYVEGENVR